jgi:hypothetical protein
LSSKASTSLTSNLGYTSGTGDMAQRRCHHRRIAIFESGFKITHRISFSF